MGKRIYEIGKGDWGYIGGHVEFEESITEAAKREVLEEVGITVKSLEFVGAVNQPYQPSKDNEPKHYLQTVFVSHDFSGEASNLAPDEHEELKWFDIDNLPENVFFAHKRFMDLALKPGRLIEEK